MALATTLPARTTTGVFEIEDVTVRFKTSSLLRLALCATDERIERATARTRAVLADDATDVAIARG